MALVASSPVSYEEARRQRVEENKRRMEELGLMDLSKSLKVQNTPPRKPLKRRMPSLEDLGLEARRSSRVAGKPVVSYRDQLDIMPGMRARCGTRERQGLARRYMSDRARMAAIDAAEGVYNGIKNPAFVKPMLHSHTASGFWLGLPAIFCKSHLPHRDERVMLEDEKQMEWECVYLANKVGLSGGWRGFSLDHDLVDGDCCIFELVSGLRFKVHIFRAHEQGDGGEEEEGEEIAVVSSEEAETDKKVRKTNAKKNAAASAPAKLSKPRKLSATAARKLELKDGEEDDDDVEEVGDSPRPSKKGLKQVKKEAETDVAGPSRSSKRRRVKEEDDVSEGEGSPAAADENEGKDAKSGKRKGKEHEHDELIELDSEEDEEDDEDVWKPATRGKSNQASVGCRSSGRTTRNSTARSLPPRPALVKASR